MIIYLPEVLQLVLNFCIGRICGGSEARTRLLSSPRWIHGFRVGGYASG
jgi:hypothetical protein